VVRDPNHSTTNHRAPPRGSRTSRTKGGTLIAEHVHDVATHERLLLDLDGYRPDLCLRCGGDVVHAHDYAERRPRGAPDVAAEIRIRRYICANKECQATWRILPAFLARHLWRVWPTVERVALPATLPAVAVSAPPPAVPTMPLAVATSATPPTVPTTPPAPIPKRTTQRWRARLASQAKQLVVLLAVSGGTLLEAIAKQAGHWATMAAGLSDHVWSIEELVERALSEPVPEPAPLAPIPSPDGWRPPEQLGLFPGLPVVIGKLLPPSVGGTVNANDNGDDAPTAPQAADALGAGAVDGEGEEEGEEAGPATMREPVPWGSAGARQG
jgi:hypothetical protein